jgi:hypothetical protein
MPYREGKILDVVLVTKACESRILMKLRLISAPTVLAFTRFHSVGP